MVAVLALLAFASAVYGRSTTPSVYVTLWFDTEDYILPQDDDAAKRVAETLTSAGHQGDVQDRRREGARPGAARQRRM